MKSLIVIALALVSVSSFAAAKHTKEEMKAAKEACKEVKGKKEHKACLAEKLAPAAPAAAVEAAPAAAPAADAHAKK